jgi:hypothetical protein
MEKQGIGLTQKKRQDELRQGSLRIELWTPHVPHDDENVMKGLKHNFRMAHWSQQPKQANRVEKEGE